MSIKKTKRLEPEKIIGKYPLATKLKHQIKQHRREIGDILTGRDERLLVIAGPCSAWPREPVLDYAERLKKLSDQVSDRLKPVMRVYSQKPRTTTGWLGPITQPDPFAKPDIEAGMEYVRSLQLAVNELGLPVADELLFTHKIDWVGDLLSWAAIGARSSEDQEHRVFASGLDLPIGLKNPTSGDLTVGVNAVLAAQHPQVYYADQYQVETDGNPLSHLVLRGGVAGANYYRRHLDKVSRLMEEKGIVNPSVIMDASHDNSKYRGRKDPRRQPAVVKKVLEQRRSDDKLQQMIKGVALESFLKTGAQKVSELDSSRVDYSGLSITDPCLGWEETEELIYQVYDKLC